MKIGSVYLEITALQKIINNIKRNKLMQAKNITACLDKFVRWAKLVLFSVSITIRE